VVQRIPSPFDIGRADAERSVRRQISGQPTAAIRASLLLAAGFTVRAAMGAGPRQARRAIGTASHVPSRSKTPADRDDSPRGVKQRRRCLAHEPRSFRAPRSRELHFSSKLSMNRPRYVAEATRRPSQLARPHSNPCPSGVFSSPSHGLSRVAGPGHLSPGIPFAFPYPEFPVFRSQW
jgi:hypothetical protein